MLAVRSTHSGFRKKGLSCLLSCFFLNWARAFDSVAFTATNFSSFSWEGPPYHDCGIMALYRAPSFVCQRLWQNFRFSISNQGAARHPRTSTLLNSHASAIFSTMHVLKFLFRSSDGDTEACTLPPLAETVLTTACSHVQDRVSHARLEFQSHFAQHRAHGAPFFLGRPTSSSSTSFSRRGPFRNLHFKKQVPGRPPGQYFSFRK